MRNTALLLSTVILASCAYAVDTSVQDITIRTPGAKDAVCYMTVNNVRYRMHPPQTTSIPRSHKDLELDCLAPGNRRKEVIIPPSYADSAVANVANAGVGLIWDHTSGALYQYPDVVEVSFVGIAEGPAFLPAQNNPDIRQPEEYALEEFLPSQPRLNSDRDMPDTLQKRGEALMSNASTGNNGDAFSESLNASAGKGDLQSVINTYSGDLNPAAVPDSGLTPIIPGE